jgi:heptosyltransferase-1
MNILIVKLSSLGDVLHNLPVVWDIRRSYPRAKVDWVVDESYVQLLEPLLSTSSFQGIDRIISFSSRRWKSELLKQQFSLVWNEISSFKKNLQQTSYDLVLDTQGLLKSAFVTNLARKAPGGKVIGIGNRTEDSGYEPLSRIFYDAVAIVPLKSHAVDRSRAVLAKALTTNLPDREALPPQFYSEDLIRVLSNKNNPLGLVKNSYVLCFHATARLAKAWSFDNWVELAAYLISHNLTPVFPWGTKAEKEMSLLIVNKAGGGLIPSSFTIQEAFTLISQARATIGVDTGLTHLSAVLVKPTVEIYVDSPIWKTEGYWSKKIYNLGSKTAPPSSAEVITSFNKILHYI